MWRQADVNRMDVKPVTDYGWKIADQCLLIEWDSTENVLAIKQRVLSLTKGCKCSTGCTSGRCGCRKKGQMCSVGCMCKDCNNSHDTPSGGDELVELAMEEAFETSELSQADLDTDEYMDWVFCEDTHSDGDESGGDEGEDRE